MFMGASVHGEAMPDFENIVSNYSGLIKLCILFSSSPNCVYCFKKFMI